MAKSIKLNNDTYIDGSAIRINRKTILDYIYPIGSIYLSWTNTDPRTLFGGTWEHISDGFLYCVVDTPRQGNLNGSTMSAETVLTVNQIPSHSHYGLYDQTNVERKQSWGTGTTHTALINGMGTNEWNGQFHVGSTGGTQGHTHNVPFTGVMVWRRTA